MTRDFTTVNLALWGDDDFLDLTMAEDLAALDQAHRERMDACECPYCIPPRIGDLLPDVLAEMRRREGK